MSRSVLIPMDDSPPSKAALEHALKTYPDAKLTVLYVINTTSSVGYGDLFPVTVQSEYGERRAEQLFEDVEQLATQHDVELETVTERGIPTRTIAEYINQNAFDHVVMGSHCRTGFNRLFLGSVAERVVRRASVPVTIVP